MMGTMRKAGAVVRTGLGWPTWIRTMTKGSKDPCATFTPSPKRAGEGMPERIGGNPKVQFSAV